MTDRREGSLDRFAFDCALDAAWATELWIPRDPDYGFVEYFEAAVARNLGLLRGFEELAEDVDARGILPQVDSEQARLVTDGGQPTDGAPAPEDDPFACSLCGEYLGTAKRVSGTDYCDSCQREIGQKPAIRTCLHCGRQAADPYMETIDISTEDEYYPEIRYLCRDCSTDDGNTSMEGSDDD